MTIVVDANVVMAAAASPTGLELFGDEELIAPPLLWPEVRSALHTAMWRGLLSGDTAERVLSTLESKRIRERHPRRLGREALQVADELGWSKTYDAEYLALARIDDVPIVSLDRRVNRAAEEVGIASQSLPA